MSIEKFTTNVAEATKRLKNNSGYIALNDLKTLDRLFKESKTILKENEKVSEKYDYWTDIRNVMQKEIKTAKKMAEDAKKEQEKVLKENNARLEKAVSEGKKDFAKYQESLKLYQESVQEEEEAVQDLKAQQRKAEAFEGQFKVQIADFETAAKALGVKVDTKKYKTAAASVNNL